ncbi:DUF6531 domain-containing protein [Streptomyces sp. RKAG337]|uniref:DUF6531 domain-containing protein n=1 Tax=Streptomyces sp. RKAG337 TaxID=2893404 RepID=UPI0020333D91|nr:DUF6531 domain-containing protein [Streptomyces sp. RKAG337]MCM2426467.1 DUF6531 domain-containing protein [Streptomyces sp. RKAG337]
MSDIVNKLVKPTIAFIDHLARKVPEALGKGHHRIAEHTHKAADHFDKVEADLANKAKTHHHPHDSGHHDPSPVAGVGVSAAAKAKSGEKAAANAVKDAEKTAAKNEKGVRPHDGPKESVPGPEKVCKTDPVDVATGDMLLPITDVQLPGALPLTLERTHISSYRHGMWFGPSWASTLDQRLQLDADGVVFVAADGMRLEYPPPRRNAEVLPVRGPRNPLTWSGVPNDPMRVSDPSTGETLVFDHPRPAPGATGAVILRLAAIEDRNDRRIDITYADDDTPALISHHGGYRIAIDRHPDLPRITGLRLLDTDGPGSGTTLARYGYDKAGDLTEVFNSSGEPLRLTYDDQHRITSWTDRNGTRYGYSYDNAGRVVRTTGSDGFMSSTFSYNGETRTTTFTDSLGHTSTYEHNDAYRLIRTTDPLGNATVQEWDEGNRLLTAATDPLGRTTRYTYDAAGSLTAVVHPDGASAGVSYNELDLPVEVTDAGGQIWRSEYDERGNRLASIDPMGARTGYTYDTAGLLTSVTNALGAQYRITNNPAGLPVAITDPLGHVTTAERDTFGRVVAATDALGNVIRVGWTVEGRVASCERADGRRETWQFDSEGNAIAYTDMAGRTTAHAVSHFDLPVSSTTTDGGTHDFTYDTERRLTKVTNPYGLTWQYEYDPAGCLISETDFNGRTLSYEYDATGRLASRTNGAGETVVFSRDLLGRLVEYRHGDESTTYAYDPSGNLHRQSNAHAEVVREYDAVGRVLAETVNSRRMSYTYDVMGRPVERRTPGGIVSTWSYDPCGFPQSLTVAGHRTDFAFDAIGRETTRSFGDGITFAQGWDSTGRATSQSIARGPGAERTLLQQREYTYRADDFLTEIQELTTGTRRFNVDATGRITGVQAHGGWTENYAYDALGNLTEAATPLARPDDAAREFSGTQLRRAGRTSYEYDAQGRTTRTAKRLLNGQVRTRTFAWNAQDQLTATVTPDGVHWQYRYDPAGRRIAKQRVATDGTIAEEIHFSWADTRLAEQTPTDGRSTTWEYTPGTHRPLAQVDHDLTQTDVDARFHAIITDLVGTPTELVSPEGELAWQQRTTLWGIPATDPGADTIDCPLRFPGQYADHETGWNFNYFRHYDPEAARYTTQDPLGLSPAPNPSAYVSNPHAWADTLGLKASWEPADITWGGRVRYGDRDAARGNRATGVTATIGKDMLGGHTDAQVDPAGWQSGQGYNRAHLLGALLGGSNEDPRNFATMHEFANSPAMRHYELQIQAAVRNGEIIQYSATPVYRTNLAGDVVPVGMTIEAHGSNGFSFKTYSPDKKTRRDMRNGEGTNVVTILNVPKQCP